MFLDGPAPLGLRFQVNSASVSFHKKEWFEIPRLEKSVIRRINKEKEVTKQGLRLY